MDETATGVTPEELGEVLVKLRKQSGMTGEALGRATGISQSKVSKIEQGKTRLSVEEVTRIAKALDAPDETIAMLVDLAERLQSGPRRPSIVAHPEIDTSLPSQQELQEREARARHIRNFEVMTIPSLLQISEYSRRIFNNFFAFTYGEAEPRYADSARAVSVRAERQVQMYDPARSFEFVMMESALSTPLLTPGYMLAQIDRLEFAATQPNVTIRIVPNGTEYVYPAGYGFTLLDDDAVLAEFGHTPVCMTDELNLALHRRVFEYFSEIAVPDIGPILTKYKTIYADEARPKE